MHRSMISGSFCTPILLAIGVFCASPAQAGLIHDYEFKGNLNDSLGGPALTSLGGTIGASSYTFAAQQGLTLSNALSSDGTYSIDLSFRFDTLGGYQKILDFKNLASDNGLYSLGTALDYYLGSPINGTGAFSPGVFARVDLTRDGSSNLVTAYLNGVAQFSFTDSGADATFTASNRIINFFQDDNVTGGRESASGSVNQIRIYDTALSGSEIAALASVPEPSAVVLMATGLALAGLGGRRLGRPRSRG